MSTTFMHLQGNVQRLCVLRDDCTAIRLHRENDTGLKERVQGKDRRCRFPGTLSICSTANCYYGRAVSKDASAPRRTG